MLQFISFLEPVYADDRLISERFRVSCFVRFVVPAFGFAIQENDTSNGLFTGEIRSTLFKKGRNAFLEIGRAAGVDLALMLQIEL